jgi:hypothetical protein
MVEAGPAGEEVAGGFRGGLGCVWNWCGRRGRLLGWSGDGGQCSAEQQESTEKGTAIWTIWTIWI